MSKNRNRYIGIVLLGICVVGILSTGNAYSQKKVITIKKSRNAYQSRYDILRKEYHPDIRKLLKLNATFSLQGKGETASFFLGCSFNDADGILVDLKPGILKLLQREPKVYGLGMSSNTGYCDGCTERLDFNHSILKDLPRLTQLRYVTLDEIDFRDAKQYKYIQPLKNLQRLGFSSCAVSIHKLITLTGPYPNMKELYVRQGYAIPFDRRKVPDVSKIELITEKAMLKFVKASPNLEVLTLGSDLTTRIEYKAVLALAKLKKLKKLALYGGTYGYFPFGRYPPEIIKQHKILYKYLKKELPDCKEIRVGPGVIDWPGMGLPKPVPRKCPLCH